MAALRAAAGASADDPRLICVELDLQDQASVTAAAAVIEDAVGAPYALVHNAGISAAGAVEETPITEWEKMFATHVLGPVTLTKALLPGMRAAGRGRIVMVSSQGGVRGMPAIAAYSASKGALERWAESLSGEIAPFGLGVTVLVAGTFDTAIITDAGTTDLRDFDGPYARHHQTIDRRGRRAMRMMARAPDHFAAGLSKALEDTKPFRRRPIGPDARMLLIANRVLPAAGVHQMTRLAMGLPRQGRMSSTATPPMGMKMRTVVLAARVLPAPVLLRLSTVAAKLSRSHPPGTKSENHG